MTVHVKAGASHVLLPHPDCTQKKQFEGKCKKHCDKTNAQYIAMLKQDAEAAKRSRAKKKAK